MNTYLLPRSPTGRPVENRDKTHPPWQLVRASYATPEIDRD